MTSEIYIVSAVRTPIGKNILDINNLHFKNIKFYSLYNKMV